MAVEMNDFEELVWEYLTTHKTPAHPKKLAKRWIVSEAKVARVLKRFEKEGIVDLVKLGTQKFYKVKD
jgi:uncharacterized membrane protein